MSKSALVMETPKNCYECPFSCTNGNDTDCGYCELEMYFIDGEVVIDEEYFDFESEEKPDWCPLKPLPGKMKVTGLYNGEYFKAGGKPPSYKIGWNACIDEITGGNIDD